MLLKHVFQEMANTYPNSNFTGIDVSSAWPSEIRPSNSNFIVSNIIHDLPLEENSIDYAYMRFLGLGIPNYQFPIVLANIFKVLKPGGWIELVDVRTGRNATYAHATSMLT